MQEETSPAKRRKQLTSDLETQFTNELKKTRTSPERRHYLDFGELRWVVETAGELD